MFGILFHLLLIYKGKRMNLNYKTLFTILLIAFSIVTTIPLLIQISFAKVSDIKIDTPKGKLGAYLVEPYTEPNRDFVFVVIHGFSASRIYMRPLAIEIGRLGFISLVIDLPGHYTAGFPLEINWDNKDLKEAACNGLAKTVKDVMPAVFEEAKRAVNNDSAKIVLVGHSLGGALSIIWGANSKDVEMVFAIAPLPPFDYVNETSPSKLIIMLGTLDEIFSFDEQIKLLKKAGWADAKINQEYKKGNIWRALYAIPNADHITEPHTDFVVEKIARYVGEVIGKDLEVGIVFSPVEMFIGNIIAPIVGLALLILFPFVINPIFGYSLRKKLDDAILSPRPKKSGKRDTIFALIYGGFAYVILLVTWGVNLTPMIPMSFLRFSYFLLVTVFVVIYFSIHEFIFKRLVPRILKNRVKRIFITSSLISFIARYLTLILMFLSLYFLASSFGLGSTEIILRLTILVAFLIILVVIIMEMLSSITLIMTERFSAVVVSNIFPWSFILASFFPIIVIPI